MPTAEVVAKTVLPAGFHLSVFAAEPDVQQPIAMATDPRGRLWVAENYTYSEVKVGYHPDLRDRILMFADTNNSGHFNQRTVFWDDAQRLTSVEVGLGGVWALALPNLVFIPDANGDGIPDGPPQIVLDGFESAQARHTVANGLRWGPDGWLYGRHGILGTSLVGPPGTPAGQRIPMNVGIWRYHPTRRIFEVVARGTTNPWGMDWDPHGELFFINTVIGHLWHVIPGAHYRRMFGEDPTPNVFNLIEQTADHVHWATGEVWTDVRKGVTDLTAAAGGGHAHTGLLIYQGGQWPETWNGRVLTINYHGRRLNVDQLERQGGGFVGRHQPDALVFADPWFRGIDVIAAPDGGVFVSDWSDAGECHDNEGIHRTSGRIYKLTYGAPNLAPADLTALGEVALAQLQTSPNDWQARQARRVLADRAHAGAPLHDGRAALTRLASSDPEEVHRLRALWALHVSGGVDPSLLRDKLKGAEYERAWALRLQADAADFAGWAESVLPEFAAKESSALVRVTLASLLQKLPLSHRAPLARELLAHAEDATDHNQPLMLWYGIEPLAATDPGFAELLAGARLPLVQRLGARRLAQDLDSAPQRVNALLRAIARNPSAAVSEAVLDGLAEGLAGRRQVFPPAAWAEVAPRLMTGANDSLRSRILDLGAGFGDRAALGELTNLALDRGAESARRRAALASLIRARVAGLAELCDRLLTVRELAGVAAGGLALSADPAVADRLLAEWPNLDESARPPVLNVLLSRPAWTMKLLDGISAGKLRRSDLGVAQARQIRDLQDAALTRKLGEVWGVLQDPDETTKRVTLAKWKQKLTPGVLQSADPAAGQKLFGLTCAGCHQLYGAGADLGPELTGAGRQNLDYLLGNILFPSEVVAADYRPTTLNLKDGRVLTGIVRSRTAQALVLAMIGETATISRGDIAAEQVSALSLMPEGLLDGLTDQQAADLMRFLMSQAPPAPARR